MDKLVTSVSAGSSVFTVAYTNRQFYALQDKMHRRGTEVVSQEGVIEPMELFSLFPSEELMDLDCVSRADNRYFYDGLCVALTSSGRTLVGIPAGGEPKTIELPDSKIPRVVRILSSGDRFTVHFFTSEAHYSLGGTVHERNLKLAPRFSKTTSVPGSVDFAVAVLGGKWVLGSEKGEVWIPASDGWKLLRTKGWVRALHAHQVAGNLRIWTLNSAGELWELAEDKAYAPTRWVLPTDAKFVGVSGTSVPVSWKQEFDEACAGGFLGRYVELNENLWYERLLLLTDEGSVYSPWRLDQEAKPDHYYKQGWSAPPPLPQLSEDLLLDAGLVAELGSLSISPFEIQSRKKKVASLGTVRAHILLLRWIRRYRHEQELDHAKKRREWLIKLGLKTLPEQLILFDLLLPEMALGILRNEPQATDSGEVKNLASVLSLPAERVLKQLKSEDYTEAHVVFSRFARVLGFSGRESAALDRFLDWSSAQNLTEQRFVDVLIAYLKKEDPLWEWD